MEPWETSGWGRGKGLVRLFSSYSEAHNHRAWEPDSSQTEVQTSEGAECKVIIKRRQRAHPLGKQVRPSEKKIIQYNLISFTHAHPFEVKKTGRGCLNNFLPNENCCGNCSGAICVAPKLWCSGKKGNQARDHRFWQSWADLLLFPLTGLTELETSASECRPTWVWIPAPPPT